MNIKISYLCLIISGILFGGVVFGGKLLTNLGFSWIELLVYPNSIMVFLFLIPFIKDFKNVLNISKTNLSLYMLSIFIVQIGQFTPLFMGLSVSMVILCLYTQPLWTILINKIVLKNKARLYEDIVAFFVLLGMVVLINPFSDFAFNIYGALLAIGGSIGLSIWVIVSTSLTRTNITKSSIMFLGSMAASMPFLILYPLFEKIIPDKAMLTLSLSKDFNVWVILIIYVLFSQIMSLLLFYKGAEKVSSIHSGLILLLEPVFAVLLDVVFFKTVLTPNIIIGGLLIISSNAYLIIRNSSEKA